MIMTILLSVLLIFDLVLNIVLGMRFNRYRDKVIRSTLGEIIVDRQATDADIYMAIYEEGKTRLINGDQEHGVFKIVRK